MGLGLCCWCLACWRSRLVGLSLLALLTLLGLCWCCRCVGCARLLVLSLLGLLLLLLWLLLLWWWWGWCGVCVLWCDLLCLFGVHECIACWWCEQLIESRVLRPGAQNRFALFVETHHLHTHAYTHICESRTDACLKALNSNQPCKCVGVCMRLYAHTLALRACMCARKLACLCLCVCVCITHLCQHHLSLHWFLLHKPHELIHHSFTLSVE